MCIFDSPFRFPIVDFESGTNGDALLLQLLTYDFVARNGKVIGHIHDEGQLNRECQEVCVNENPFPRQN